MKNSMKKMINNRYAVAGSFLLVVVIVAGLITFSNTNNNKIVVGRNLDFESAINNHSIKKITSTLAEQIFLQFEGESQSELINRDDFVNRIVGIFPEATFDFSFIEYSTTTLASKYNIPELLSATATEYNTGIYESRLEMEIRQDALVTYGTTSYPSIDFAVGIENNTPRNNKAEIHYKVNSEGKIVAVYIKQPQKEFYSDWTGFQYQLEGDIGDTITILKEKGWSIKIPKSPIKTIFENSIGDCGKGMCTITFTKDNNQRSLYVQKDENSEVERWTIVGTEWIQE